LAGVLDTIRRWFRGDASEARAEAAGDRPVTIESPGVESDAPVPGAVERETSTNAQVEGASDEPWPGNN
jgi:hypothetical protein